MQEHIAKVQDELNTLVKIITETVPTEQIYLFGSYAYGTPHKDSDLDLYVVIKDDAPYRAHDAIDMIGDAVHGHKTMPTDILVSKKEQFQYRLSAHTLQREVSEKGVLLYAAN
ncbi:MAG: nucleotidyltransferase domain-containing protein [Treponema sp.]|jgi:predicted nucleotidyltransferase|nr:nucleotidyltransferase domain-containing protein [Treponema sp.]